MSRTTLIDIRLTPSLSSPLSHNTGSLPPLLTDAHDSQFLRFLRLKIEGWRKNGAPNNFNTISQQVLGFETKNKFNEDTHPHYHYNMIVEQHEDNYKNNQQFKSSLQEWFRSQGYKGNAYCVRVNADVKDEKRWLRYPMKQGNFITQGIEDATQLSLLAQDEFARQVEMNLKSRQRNLDKNQFRDKLWKHLDDLKITGDKEIAQAIFHFYNDNGRDAPIFDLQNKVLNYQICRKIKDLSEIYKFWK